MPSHALKIMPLGGLGEIGMNCMVLEWDRQIVLLDCGVEFPDYRYPGADYLIPDFSYVLERLDQLKGVVATHGHDDHIGAIPFLAKHRELDVYAPRFPRGLIEAKLSEHPDAREVRFIDVEARRRFQVGPFTFDPIPVQHSTADAFGLAVETPAGVLIHSGDFKCDAHDGGTRFGLDFTPFEEWGRKGVFLLMADSTNAERPGFTGCEDEVRETFTRLLKEQTGRVMIALFASNIHRIENLLHIAHSQNKYVALLGRSMHSYVRLGHELGVISLPPETLILAEDTDRYPDDQVIVLLTGSQAEPQSALVRVAQGTHRELSLRKGDTVYLSSRFIPGNERAIMSMVDDVCRTGARLIHAGEERIHVSGHASQEELRLLLRAVKPRHFLPVHGEYHHLCQHAELAREEGVAEENIILLTDGASAELRAEGWRYGEARPLRKGVVAGGHFMDSSPELQSERLRLSRAGIVVATLLVDRESGRLKGLPRLVAHGLLLRHGSHLESLLEEAAQQLASDYEELRRREKDLDDAVRLYVRRYFKRIASHKPVVRTQFIEI